GSRGCTTTGKPNADGSTPVISANVLPSSEETKMPLWCCTHMRCGAAGHCARQWTSWAMGSWVCSGGAYSARMPSPRSVQLAPPSSGNQIPPVEPAIHTRFELRGSTQIEWMPGKSAPPQRRITPPVAAIAEREGDVVAQKVDRRDLPLLRLACDGE